MNKNENQEKYWTWTAKFHDADKEQPPVGKNVLLYSEEGGFAEGERKEDGTYIQYRWNVKNVTVLYWANMPKWTASDAFACVHDAITFAEKCKIEALQRGDEETASQIGERLSRLRICRDVLYEMDSRERRNKC